MSTFVQEGTVAVLKRILTGSTHLPGAACIGQHALFDPPAEQENTPSVARRHEAAARLCQFVCPVRSTTRPGPKGHTASTSRRCRCRTSPSDSPTKATEGISRA